MLEVAAWALEPSPAGRGRWRVGAEARRAREQPPPPTPPAGGGGGRAPALYPLPVSIFPN